MMSLRRDLYLLLLSYSDKKDHLTVEELAQFLKVEQKVWEYCEPIYVYINTVKYMERILWKGLAWGRWERTDVTLRGRF